MTNLTRIQSDMWWTMIFCSECVTASDQTQRGVCLRKEDCAANHGIQDGTCLSGRQLDFISEINWSDKR